MVGPLLQVQRHLVLPKSGGCEFTEQPRLSYVFIPLAWDDGKIRAFYPESGKPMYTIHDAHNKVCACGLMLHCSHFCDLGC